MPRFARRVKVYSTVIGEFTTELTMELELLASNSLHLKNISVSCFRIL